MQRLALTLGILVFVAGCTVRYQDPDGEAGAAVAEQQTPTGKWWAGFVGWLKNTDEGLEETLEVDWDTKPTEPQRPTGAISASRTAVPPIASADPTLETASDIRRREQPQPDANDPTLIERNWTLNRGETLEEGLRRWAGQAGLQLVWEVPRIFPIMARVELNGNFEQAFSTVMKAYATAAEPVYFDYGLYANRVLRVALKGERSE